MIRACIVGLWAGATALLASPAAAAQITAPLAGAVVTPGQTVTVRVAPDAGETIQQVAFATREGSVKPAAGTLQAEVPIPADAVGPEFIVAWVLLATGDIRVCSVEVSANPGTLRQILVDVPPVLAVIGQVASVAVTGVFDDGVTRDLAGAERGTTIQSTNPAVLGVYAVTDVIQARARGTAQLIVSNRGRTAVATVQVSVPSPADNHIPVPDAGAAQVVLPEALVTLDGSHSSDADADPLTFRWRQISGPAVLLRDPDTASPYFIAPRVSVETTLDFAVVVSDGKGATSFPAIVRVTVRP